MPESPIHPVSPAPDPAAAGRLERTRRRREMTAAIVLILMVVLGTWGQLAYFGTDSWMFLGLLNVNAVLMLIVLFLVARNVVKLLLERRRKIFGARLRTRLVLAFVSISLVPVLIMFLAANRVLNSSVDYWFTSQVENSMQAALEVGQSFYSSAAGRLRTSAIPLLNEVRQLSLDNPALDELLERHHRENGLMLAGFIQRLPTDPPVYAEKLWHTQAAFAPIWNEVRRGINWDTVTRTGFESILWADRSGDYVICALPVPDSDAVYLVIAESIGHGLLVQLDRISQGFEEYTQLKNLKKPLKISFTLILGLLSLIMVFGAVWMAFRLSRELVEPILALSHGTAQVARGELDFQLQDAGKDELGQLVDSFNRMAADLYESREHQERLNALLEERTRYIETVLENIATGVVTLDAEGRILTMNKAVCSIFSTTAHQWEGRRPAVFLQPEYAELLTVMYEHLRRHPEQPWQQGLEFVRRGRHWKLLVHAVALPAGSDEASPRGLGSVVAVIEDITELARMQRFAAWREVARRIAHEIKNPLTPIKLSAQRLERKFSEAVSDPAFSQCTGLIVREVERMQNMVTEFSSFASLPEVSLKPGNVAPLLEEVAAIFRASHSGIQWHTQIPAALPDIRLDPEALHRALLNVLGNAAEALEEACPPRGEGGRVTVRAALTAPGGDLVVEVEDNGPGLPDEDTSRLFEPYYSLKRGGTGLGLAIVRSIIQDHGATVCAFGAPGGGTVIRMEFPVPEHG
ncbi:MAG: HAMP domain-containing protein [Desulfovibrionaceae bacterium]|nr:HAMP domain-containing protein [Desulfovibrionaceae bacterium]